MTLYTSNCVRCRILERAMTAKGIVYKTSHDFDKFIKKGIMSSPILDTEDGRPVMLFEEAMSYIQGV